MRNLTIQRNKTFVGSLNALRVYIEDQENPETTIDKTPCRCLGLLKNGQTQTFPIGEEAARLYVIADQASKNYCNELYNLPAGGEDVFLSGKCHYNPAAGNPFRFDGVNDEESVKRRKKNTRKGVLIFVGAVLLGLAIGLIPILTALHDDDPKTFTESGMSITLTKGFEQDWDDDMTVCYLSEDVSVYGYQYLITENPDLASYTLDEYASEFHGLYASDPAFTTGDVVLEDGGYFTFVTEAMEDDKSVTLHVAVYKTQDSFWVIDFACYTEEYESLKPSIDTWAASVTFE